MFRLSHSLPLWLLLFFSLGPAVAAAPDSFNRWVPKGWKLIHKASGDLNRDGVDDMVLVLENTSPAHFKKKEPGQFGPDTLNVNPRRIVVLLKAPQGFTEVLRRDDLLPTQHDENTPCLEDPLANGGVSIARGNLVIELQQWLSCGSYGVLGETFTFRLQGSRFQLVGYDRSESSRNIGNRSHTSTNFLTGQRKRTTGANDFDEKPRKEKVVWQKLPAMPAFFLDDLSLSCDPVDSMQKNHWCR